MKKIIIMALIGLGLVFLTVRLFSAEAKYPATIVKVKDSSYERFKTDIKNTDLVENDVISEDGFCYITIKLSKLYPKDQINTKINSSFPGNYVKVIGFEFEWLILSNFLINIIW